MKFIVVGAGISGLAFAAAMRRYTPGVEVELYERQPAGAPRSLGYSLGMKGDGGLPVLKTLGLWDELSSKAVTIASFIFCDQRGQVLLELPATGDEKHANRRVRRQALMDTLQGAIGTAPIHMGLVAAGYRQDDQGVEVQFEDGQTARADYLIACDGAGSAIRHQMIGDQKLYLGLTVILGDAPVTSIQHPLLEGGYFMMLGDAGTSCFCYRQPDSTHVSYTVHALDDNELATHTPADLLRRVQQETQRWHPPVPEVVAQIDPDTVVVRAYYDKEPPAHVRSGRVWLIGDAAHPMCPFQGQGANMALVDALALAQHFALVAADPAGAEANAHTVEVDIVGRGHKAVLDSRSAARQFHTASHLQQGLRNVSFRFASLFIGMGKSK